MFAEPSDQNVCPLKWTNAYKYETEVWIKYYRAKFAVQTLSQPQGLKHMTRSCQEVIFLKCNGLFGWVNSGC